MDAPSALVTIGSVVVVAARSLREARQGKRRCGLPRKGVDTLSDVYPFTAVEVCTSSVSLISLEEEEEEEEEGVDTGQEEKQARPRTKTHVSFPDPKHHHIRARV